MFESACQICPIFLQTFALHAWDRCLKSESWQDVLAMIFFNILLDFSANILFYPSTFANNIFCLSRPYKQFVSFQTLQRCKRHYPCTQFAQKIQVLSQTFRLKICVLGGVLCSPSPPLVKGRGGGEWE